jgi:hypothetical protein
MVSDTTDNVPSANNFIAADWKLFEPEFPWAFSNTLYWRKDLDEPRQHRRRRRSRIVFLHQRGGHLFQQSRRDRVGGRTTTPRNRPRGSGRSISKTPIAGNGSA